MIKSYIVDPVIWDQEPGSIVYYLLDNGSRFMKIASTGLERLETMSPSDYVDYDSLFRPRIKGVDII